MGDFTDIQLPDYTLIRPLGHGAMAQVYLAVQNRLQRQVALKIMAASLVADPTFRERFLREGRVIAQFTHPNIVTIYDINVHDPYYYMAMQYADGGATLKDKIAAGLSEQQAVKVISEIASALHYAHQRGFVHRDVKPANILFTQDNHALLSDFGIVKPLQDGTELTQQGLTVGTPAYMSPEQILGRPVDARSDLYSLGIVLFEALTGAKPFHAEETFALAMKQVSEPIPRLPAELARYQAIIDRLLAKKPEQRFASGAELIDALSQVSRTAEDSVATAVISTEAGRLDSARQSASSVSIAAPARNAPAPPTADADHPADTRPGQLPSATRPGTPWRQRRWWLRPWALATALTIALTAAAVALYPPLRQQLASVLTPLGGSDRCQSPTLSQQQRNEMGQLLEVAAMHFEFDRLVYPDFSNAAYAYDQALTLDPCDQRARTGLQQVADRLAARVSAEMAGGAKPSSELLSEVEAGLSWIPNHSALLDLRQRLSNSELGPPAAND